MKPTSKFYGLTTGLALIIVALINSLEPDARKNISYIIVGIIIFCIVTDKPIRWYLNRKKTQII
jgi:hypothetical protein